LVYRWWVAAEAPSYFSLNPQPALPASAERFTGNRLALYVFSDTINRQGRKN
jgi:hypothetical protein